MGEAAKTLSVAAFFVGRKDDDFGFEIFAVIFKQKLRGCTLLYRVMRSDQEKNAVEFQCMVPYFKLPFIKNGPGIFSFYNMLVNP